MRTYPRTSLIQCVNSSFVAVLNQHNNCQYTCSSSFAKRSLSQGLMLRPEQAKVACSCLSLFPVGGQWTGNDSVITSSSCVPLT